MCGSRPRFPVTSLVAVTRPKSRETEISGALIRFDTQDWHAPPAEQAGWGKVTSRVDESSPAAVEQQRERAGDKDEKTIVKPFTIYTHTRPGHLGLSDILRAEMWQD